MWHHVAVTWHWESGEVSAASGVGTERGKVEGHGGWVGGQAGRRGRHISVLRAFTTRLSCKLIPTQVKLYFDSQERQPFWVSRAGEVQVRWQECVC